MSSEALHGDRPGKIRGKEAIAMIPGIAAALAHAVRLEIVLGLGLAVLAPGKALAVDMMVAPWGSTSPRGDAT